MKLFLLLCLSTSVLACGLRLPKNEAPEDSVARSKRYIVGGANVTDPGKWPWQVLLTFNKGPWTAACGGTIIGENWVLTAAHCAQDTSNTIVITGTTLKSEAKKEYKRGVIGRIVHPEYDDKTLVNDIALLKLNQSFVFDDVVASICLPHPSQSIVDDSQAVVTGFGKIDVDINGTILVVPQRNPQLHEAIVPIINPEVCKEKLSHDNTTGLNETEILEILSRAHLVCASSLAHGTHQGDSGGPLIMKGNNGRWFQIGITSAGHCDSKNCEAPGDGIRGDEFPKIFTDVRKYCKWIGEATGGEVNCYGEEVVLEDAGIAA